MPQWGRVTNTVLKKSDRMASNSCREKRPGQASEERAERTPSGDLGKA